jgi:MFS family permease
VSGALRRVLAARRFRLAVAAHALTATAQSLPVVALAVYVYQRTQSPGWVAVAAAARLVPRIAFSAVGGVVGDGHDRRRVLLGGNLLAAATTGLLAVLTVLGAPVVAVVAVAFVAATTTVAAYPAMVASLPRLAGPGQLVAANTVVSTVESAAFIAGPGLGGLLLALSSPAVVFAAGAVGFLVAATTVRRADPWDGDRHQSQPETVPVRRRLLEGVEVCASHDARALVVVLLATELLYGCTVVLLVLVGHGGGRAGLLNAALAAGALAAVAFADPLARGRRPGAVIVASTLASGLPLVALAATTSPLVSYVLLVGCGLASTVVEVQAKTLLQLVAGEDVMARVFGLLDGLASVAMLAGSVAAPLLVARIGLGAALVVVGVELPVLALLPLAAGRVAGRALAA